MRDGVPMIRMVQHREALSQEMVQPVKCDGSGGATWPPRARRVRDDPTALARLWICGAPERPEGDPSNPQAVGWCQLMVVGWPERPSNQGSITGLLLIRLTHHHTTS